MTIGRCLAGLSVAIFAAGPLYAQGFDRDRNESVQDRAAQRSQAQPIRAGSFNLFPAVGVSGMFNDNFRAVTAGKESDFIISVSPQVILESNWPRHTLRGTAFLNTRVFLENDDETHTDWGGNSELELNFAGPVIAALRGGYANLHEVRTSPSSPAAAREPVSFDNASIGASLSRTFNRVRIAGGIDFDWLDFDDVLALGGGIIDQDGRDRLEMVYNARVDYAVSPSTSLFAAGSVNERDYDIAGLTSRDSDGFGASIGANFDLGALARGELAVGYVEQDYDSALFTGVSGVGVNAGVEYFPTELTTVTFDGRVAAEETSIAGATGYLAQSVGVRIDHELLRTVIVNGRVSYSRDDYEGIDRLDGRWGTGIGAVYMMNRSVGLSTEYSYFRQDSSGAAAFGDYSVNVLSFSVVLRPS